MLGNLSALLPFDKSIWPLLRRGVGAYTRKHIGKILVALLLMAVASAGISAIPLFLEAVIDKSQQTGPDAFNDALLIGLGFLVVFLIRGGANMGQEAIMSYVGNRIVADIQHEMYAHVMRADLAYFHDRAAGGIISNFINDTNKMRTVFANTITGIGRDGLTLIFLVGVMFYQDWVLACVMFVVFPLVVVPVDWLGRKMRRVARRTQEEMAEFTTVLGRKRARRPSRQGVLARGLRDQARRLGHPEDLPAQLQGDADPRRSTTRSSSSSPGSPCSA